MRPGYLRALTPFRTSAYRRLAVALVLSTFATGVWMVAQVWEVISLGGGPAELSLVSTASALGVLLPALLAGVVADRIPQKSILLGVAAVEVGGMGLVGAFSLTEITQPWHLAAAAFVIGTGMTFYYPAYSAWLPALVPESDLLAINGFEGMVRPSVGQALGPAVAGVVVGAANPGSAVLVAAGSAALGMVALATVPKTRVRRDLAAEPDAHPVRAVLTDVGQGFTYMWRTPWLLATLLFASLLILLLMGPLQVLTPFIIKDRLGGGPDEHAWVLAAFGVGGAVGSLVMASTKIPRRYLTWMNLTWGFGCLPMILIGFGGAVWMIIAAAFVIGLCLSAPMVIWGTLLQARVPPALLGRVASLDFFVSTSLMPVSMAVAGPVSELIGLRPTFVIAGVVPVFASVVAILWAKLPADEIANPLRQRNSTPTAA